MDYSKLPLARRTRLQESVFFQQFNEEKKRKKKEAAEKQRASESSAGDRAITYGGSGADGAADSRSTENSVRFQPAPASTRLQEGFGPVGENPGARSDKEGNVGRFDGERMGESSERTEEERKKEVTGIDMRRKRKSLLKSKRKEKNVCQTDGDEDGDDDDVVFIRTDYSNAEVGVNDDDDGDEDYMGSSDFELEDNSSSCSDSLHEEDGLGVKGNVSKAGLKRCRGKSPEVVFLRQLGGEGEGNDGNREESPEVVYIGQKRGEGDGGDVRKESFVEEEAMQESSRERGRRREESPEIVYIGQKRGEGGGLDGSDLRKEGLVEEEAMEESSRGKGRPLGKKNSSLVGGGESEGSSELLKRKKYSGLDILVGGCEKEQEEEPRSVAGRLGPRRRRGGKAELGSFSSPFTLTDEDDEDTDSADSDSDRNAKDSKNVDTGGKSKVKVGKRRCDHGDSDARMSVDANSCFKDGNGGKTVGKSHEKAKGEVGRPAKRRHSAARIPVEKILADSIWQKSDVLVEELVSSKVPDMEPTLPLKFKFLDEDPITPEKSPWDTEADKLFAEMDFVRAACAIGDSDSSMVENEDSFTEETESDPATSCRQGKHQLVLDEQIGLKCKFCSFVKLEIKHILPSFSKHPLGRPDNNYWNGSDHFNFEKLQFQDSASTPNSRDQIQICAEGTVWDIIPGIKTTMYAHQREGLEFIWKNIGGSINLEELKKSACNVGSGCIISHAPGTGKTRLAIVFLQTFMQLYPKCRPVIVAPRSMLLIWEEEFKKWKVDIPFHNLNQPEFSGQENEAALNLLNKAGRRGKNVNSVRLVKLFSWARDKSVLGISYRLFEKLAEDGIVSAIDEGCSKTKRKSKRYAEAEKVRKMLLEFPGLLVLDEGHTPRNDQSLMWRALSGVETQRRILLSGTPFQNNFDELFNTLCLVRPKFCDRILTGVKGDFRKNRGREGRKGRGKWASLTKSIGEVAGNKLNELRAIIDPFVHVYKGMILEENLPGLRVAVVILNPTDLQKSLIGVTERQNVFKREHLASLISVHPSLLLGSLLSDEEGLAVDTNKLETLRFDPKAGVKTNFLMELIRLSMAAKEKVLVFSQFIEPLTFIREQLKLSFGWTEGKDLLYMDGQIEARHRQSSIALLNDPDSEVQVLLASIRACSEGISLVGASRVVLLDVVWNPSVVRQAISRAYRIGQKKVVYIYHLILSGTMEGEKCVRQAEKYRLSELVFSSADGKLHGKEGISCAVNDDKILQEMVQHEKLSFMFEKIVNQPKESK